MGRPKKKISEEELIDISTKGYSMEDAASLFDVSIPTIRARIADLQASESVVLQYKALQKIQLGALQAKVLDAISPSKVEEASLRDLIYAFSVLHKAESEGQTDEKVKGLLSYLMEIEDIKMAREMNLSTIEGEFSIDAEGTSNAEFEEVEEALPNL